MRVLLALLLSVTAIGACVQSRVLRDDWNEPRRDPDPTADPTQEPTGNPWAPEQPEERIGGPSPAPPDAGVDGS